MSRLAIPSVMLKLIFTFTKSILNASSNRWCHARMLHTKVSLLRRKIREDLTYYFCTESWRRSAYTKNEEWKRSLEKYFYIDQCCQCWKVFVYKWMLSGRDIQHIRIGFQSSIKGDERNDKWEHHNVDSYKWPCNVAAVLRWLTTLYYFSTMWLVQYRPVWCPNQLTKFSIFFLFIDIRDWLNRFFLNHSFIFSVKASSPTPSHTMYKLWRSIAQIHDFLTQFEKRVVQLYVVKKDRRISSFSYACIPMLFLYFHPSGYELKQTDNKNKQEIKF